jgi:hypothetical protein
MRIKSLMALVAMTAAFFAISQSASAFEALHRPDLRRHHYDPGRAEALDRYYHYYYDPRGWYPYYNSGEWGRPYVKRFRGELPPYYASWGSNNRRYRHVEWHRRHYGGHRRGDW